MFQCYTLVSGQEIIYKVLDDITVITMELFRSRQVLIKEESILYQTFH